MENSYQTNDVLDQHRPKSLPGMLNVLTILTFIGCGLGFFNLYRSNILNNGDPQQQIQKLNEARDKAQGNSFLTKMIDSSIDIFQKSWENRNLLLYSGLVFICFCLIGAILMRKFKKLGYYLYLIGELAPVVLMAGLFGSSFFGSILLLFIALISVVFVILYSTQLKHLK